MTDIDIIDNPGLKSFIRNIGEWTVTVFMWGIWVYFFLPIVNIVLWLMGVRYFYSEVIAPRAYTELLSLLGNLGWIILGVFLVLRLWGYYNYARFGKLNRRKFPAPTTADDLSRFCNIPVERIVMFQGQKEVFWPSQYEAGQDDLLSLCFNVGKN